MRLTLCAAPLLLLSAAAPAESMNAEQFYQRATALQHKGIIAVFSAGAIKALTAEAQAAGKRSAEMHHTAVKAGKTPRFCPTGGSVKMNDKELMARLAAIPATERSRIDMTEAMNRIFAAKFPCRG